ncbi:2-keto-3-deoxygluconate permease [Skermanella stibiiresistens SB22]|uniref:Hydroxylamine reductase n=1 Tax=Skermanella stibiiresistens SB22 TaxID=1385369 RepID=W9HFS4_9PROT|nr:hydroxylamine reductase [Skermanella stibiiresistens]EWY42738.1 2-keto-3-deoxygluconate permease [Skermanella stibiiresistens SB22]
MFCYQCEQTQHIDAVAGCHSLKGTCGKDAVTSDLQDILIHAVKGLAQVSHRARALGVTDAEVDDFIHHALFTTLTNVNFNPVRIELLIRQAVALRDGLGGKAAAMAPVAVPPGPARYEPPATHAEMLAEAASFGVRAGVETVGEDVIGLRVLVLYGMKGVAAYYHHATVLGFRDPAIDAGIARILSDLAGDPSDIAELLALALDTGTLNLKVMELLDAANTGTYGTPEPTVVRMTPVPGKAILVSGHDLGDLARILEQTRDTGILVYTHGELLPANAYPALKAHPHLAGNFGGAWQDQQSDFAAFPGPVVLTSNCLIEPQRSYKGRVFTAGPVGWPGVRHIDNGDFSPVIQAAKASPGFGQNVGGGGDGERTITIGFARDAVMGVAGTVIDAVKSGAIRRFFLIGGCDGAAPGRNYYTEVAEAAPADTVMLTLGCGKFRINDQDHGTIGGTADGIPRLLDLGQCNDAYSAIKIAMALADAFECGVNDLPLSLMVSWFEQKATAVLLTMLALGIKGIHLGPTLPAFLTPTLLAVLQERLDLRANGEAAADVARALGQAA